MNTTQENKGRTGERLQSLDALRGFDMFWIIGGGALITALAKSSSMEWLQPVAEQMKHVSWEGFRFYDLIFPLFMFIAGVAIPFSITAKLEQGALSVSLLKKIIRRGLLLVVFGIVYNGLLQKGFKDARYASVLGQIGVAYMIGAAIVLYNKSMRSQGFWIAGIVAFIAILQHVVPVPGAGAGQFHPEHGINAWLDRLLLPGRLHGKTFDPEGILCMVSASIVVLTGAMAGNILRSTARSQNTRTLILLVSGIGLIAAALMLSPVYPIIKSMWTVTFNFLTSGISLVLLSLFYYLIDVRKIGGKFWGSIWFFFKVIGLNSITIYMAARIIPFRTTSNLLTGWLVAPVGEWVVIFGVLVIEWLLLYYLYKQKIFLRI